MLNLNLVKLCRFPEYVIPLTLILSCAFNLIEAARIICLFVDCSNIRKIYLYTIFPRAIAIGCMISLIVNVYNKTYALKVYEDKMQTYRIYYPTRSDKEHFRRRMVILIAVTCAIATVPINVYRLMLIYSNHHSVKLTGFYAQMYIQNIAMNVGEVQFFKHCTRLYQHFQTINEEMSALKSEIIVANGYPLILKSDGDSGNANRIGSTLKRERSPMADACSLVDIIEQLKCRHKYISNAVRKLNGLYGLQLGLSLSVLFLMALTDIYVFLSLPPSSSRQHIFYCAWFFQYSFRFFTIVMTTDATTKEANKSKTIITDINNRSIDNCINEELQLFLNELSSRSVDFTTYDLFIINRHLIISAFVTGTSFLLMYFQIR